MDINTPLWGVRVDGPLGRRFLRGLSLTRLWREGCGIALRAMSIIMPPFGGHVHIEVTSTSSIIIILTLVHPFATSWPSSPKGDARTLRIYLSASYGKISILLNYLPSADTPPIRLRRTSPTVRSVNRKEGPFMGRLRDYFDRLAHPMQDVHRGRINRSMLSCRDMAPWLSIHSPTTKWWQVTRFPTGREGGAVRHQRGVRPAWV